MYNNGWIQVVAPIIVALIIASSTYILLGAMRGGARTNRLASLRMKRFIVAAFGYGSVSFLFYVALVGYQRMRGM